MYLKCLGQCKYCVVSLSAGWNLCIVLIELSTPHSGGVWNGGGQGTGTLGQRQLLLELDAVLVTVTAAQAQLRGKQGLHRSDGWGCVSSVAVRQIQKKSGEWNCFKFAVFFLFFPNLVTSAVPEE